MEYAAIIFDCDGTLVDSEALGNQVLVECIREYGKHLTVQEAMNLFKGLRMAETVKRIESLLGHKLPQSFTNDANQRMDTKFASELQAIHGVERLIQELPVPYCVASNGPRDKVKANLTVAGLIQYFEHQIYSAYDIGSWKPEPDLFLHAARTLKVAPNRCAVIEDSLVGVRAGIAAGMKVFAYVAQGENPDHFMETGAQPFFSMTELPELLCQPN